MKKNEEHVTQVVLQTVRHSSSAPQLSLACQTLRICRNRQRANIVKEPPHQGNNWVGFVSHEGERKREGGVAEWTSGERRKRGKKRPSELLRAWPEFPSGFKFQVQKPKFEPTPCLKKPSIIRFFMQVGRAWPDPSCTSHKHNFSNEREHYWQD